MRVEVKEGIATDREHGGEAKRTKGERRKPASNFSGTTNAPCAFFGTKPNLPSPQVVDIRVAFTVLLTD